MKKIGLLLVAILLAFFVALLTGCETLENGDDYDTKPIDLKRLLEKIKTLLEPQAIL